MWDKDPSDRPLPEVYEFRTMFIGGFLSPEKVYSKDPAKYARFVKWLADKGKANTHQSADKLEIVAQRKDENVYVISDDGGKNGYVYDADSKRVFERTFVQSIFARGYWSGFTGSSLDATAVIESFRKLR